MVVEMAVRKVKMVLPLVLRKSILRTKEIEMKKYERLLQNMLTNMKVKLEEKVELKSEQEKLMVMFEKCFTNTLDTTVNVLEDGTTYVITGDIPAMWLRDSTCQLRPYLLVAREEPEVANIIEGLVRKQMKCIIHDPYANAFNQEDNGNCWEKDETEMTGWIWERKYEIDSLCFPVQLGYLLWKNTGKTEQFDDTFRLAVNKILEVWRIEQDHEGQSNYRFIRPNCYYTDTLSRDGKGALVKSNIGLTWSGFRPSDDACMYGYLIPSNMFAVVVLEYIETIALEVWKDEQIAQEASSFAKEIREAIETYGVVDHYKYGKMYAYEVDGFGQYHLMDDANVPSLLASTYLGYVERENEIYQNTRAFILGDGNPYYYKGKVAKGIGSPHTPINYIWHIALSMQGLTGTQEEKLELLKMIVATDGGTNLMHEGFDVDDSTNFTRDWFSWANAMFCELLLDYCGWNVER